MVYMAKQYAESFYNSSKWRRISKKFMDSKYKICNRCGRPAKIVHHIIYITPQNINDPNITLNWDNLEALCQDCHNEEHHYTGNEKRNDIEFDRDGNVISRK